MGLSDLLSFVIPASVLGIAYVLATLTFRKLPAGIPFLNFHVVAYGGLLALNLLLMVLMEKIRAVDLNVDDAVMDGKTGKVEEVICDEHYRLIQKQS